VNGTRLLLETKRPRKSGMRVEKFRQRGARSGPMPKVVADIGACFVLVLQQSR